MTRISLLSNVTGATTGASFNVANAGEYVYSVGGTFSGAVKLQQLSPDGVNWIDVLDATLSAAGAVIVALGAGRAVRAVAAGGTNMYCDLDRIG